MTSATVWHNVILCVSGLRIMDSFQAPPPPLASPSGVTAGVALLCSAGDSAHHPLPHPLLSTSVHIKLPTGAIPLSSSSAICFCSCSAALSLRAHFFKPTDAKAWLAILRGLTSGRVLGTYHRLKIFSLMKSPWYPRRRAFAVHRRQLSVSLYSVRFVIFSRGP